MAPRREFWRAGQRQRATVAIGAAAVLLAQLGLAYVVSDSYQAAIGRALNQFTDVSSPEAPPVGPPLRIAGSRDADAVPTPAATLVGRTVALGPSAPPPPVESVGTAPGPPPLPQPSTQPGPAAGAGDDAEEPQAGGAEPPLQVERDSVRDEDDGGRVDRDDGNGGSEEEEEQERGRPQGVSASSHQCSTSWSERDDERDEACEERGRDQRDERDESRVDGRGEENEHRSSSEERDDRRSDEGRGGPSD